MKLNISPFQDFGLTKDQRDVKNAINCVANQINNYIIRLDDIGNAQLHTAEKITGQNANNYLLLKLTFASELFQMRHDEDYQSHLLDEN